MNGKSIISKETLVPISLVCVILGAALWMDRRMSGMEHTHALEAAVINLKLDAIQTAMDARTGDRWSASDMAHWSDLLKASNPSLSVPAPKASE